MDNSGATAKPEDQADDEIFTSTLSDEALEATAGPKRGAFFTMNPPFNFVPC